MLFRGLYLFLLSSIVILSVSAAALAEPEQEVVAQVGNVKVTVYELAREMQRILPLNSSFHSGVSKEKVVQIRQNAMKKLVDQAYKVQYALENEISVSNSELEDRITRIKAKYKTEENFKKALRDEKLADLRSSIYRSMLAQKAEDIVVNEPSKVPEEKILKYYEEKKNHFQRPKRYRFSQILIKVDPTLVRAEQIKLLVKAEDLLERAEAGEDFYDLAYYNSDEAAKFVGGDLGYLNSGQIVRELENAIKNLNPGDIVGPVETRSGYHIIKMTDVQEPRPMEYDEIKVKIKEKLEGEIRDDLYGKWMTGLKEKYTAEIYYK